MAALIWKHVPRDGELEQLFKSTIAVLAVGFWAEVLVVGFSLIGYCQFATGLTLFLSIESWALLAAFGPWYLLGVRRYRAYRKEGHKEALLWYPKVLCIAGLLGVLIFGIGVMGSLAF